MTSCFGVPSSAVHGHHPPTVDPASTRARILLLQRRKKPADRPTDVGMSLERMPDRRRKTTVCKQPCEGNNHCPKSGEALDLPDGSCFNRSMLLSLISRSSDANCGFVMRDSAVRECQYFGSFPVADVSSADSLRDQLNQKAQEESLEEGRQVLVLITLTGLKICSPKNKSVLMAHALRRISLATCDPGHRLFSFLAREPALGGPQYCHTFRTHTAAQAEELSRLLGNAFRMAYAHQLQPTFLELLGQTKVVNNANHNHQSPSSCSSPGSAAKEPHRHRKRTEINRHPDYTPPLQQPTAPPATPPAEKVWAKTAAPKHHEPLFAGLLQPSPSPVGHAHGQHRHPLAPASPAPRPSHLQQQPGGSGLNSGHLGIPESDLWSPGSTSSCEDNTKLPSPTDDNNSCTQQVREKPPLVKTLHEAWTRPCPMRLSPFDHHTATDDPSSPMSGGPCTSSAETNCSSPTSSRPAEAPTIPLKTQDSPDDPQSITMAETTLSSPKRDVRPRVLQVSFPATSGVHRKSPPEEPEEAFLSSCSSSSSASSSKRASAASSSDNNFVCTDSDASTPCKKKGGYAPPSPPERMDSLSPQQEAEKRELRGAPWFQAGIPREIALEILSQEPQGSFMVRESTTKPGCYALSLRVPRDFQPTGIAHYLILRTLKGYKIKGFTKEFGTLTSLITHHSVMPELLPCPLSLSRYNPVFRKQDTSQDLVDIEQDPDYNLLADFRKVMATQDLKV